MTVLQGGIRVHATADVSPDARIGAGTSIWHQAQVRDGARLGCHCIVGKGVFIDTGVRIGNNVKIQNYVSLYQGVVIEDGVLVGPHVCFTNDKRPRAVNADGSLKAPSDWVVGETLVREGATLGANATIVSGTTVGRWAMVGSGSVVTRDVPDFGLVWGNPARLRGFVCPCGERLRRAEKQPSDDVREILMVCPQCSREIGIPALAYQQVGEI